MHRQLGPSSTKNLYSSVEREAESPGNKKGSVRMFHKTKTSEVPKTLPKKLDTEELSPKNALVTWDGSGSARKPTKFDDKTLKVSTDLSSSKKSVNYFNFYSPKASHSVEKSLKLNSNNEKDNGFAPYKNSVLPSLKLTMGHKKNN